MTACPRNERDANSAGMSGCGQLKRLNTYRQRPREASFLFATFSLDAQRKSRSFNSKIIITNRRKKFC